MEKKDEIVAIGGKILVDGVIGTLRDVVLNGINIHTVTMSVEWDSGSVGRPPRNMKWNKDFSQLIITSPKAIWALVED